MKTKSLMKNRNVTLTTTFLAIGCFAVLPKAQAVSPAPDGCYPGFTTAEGCNALNSLTTGAGNTGLGWRSLFLDTTGNFNTGLGGGTLVLNNADSNTAVGAAALLLNTSGTQNTAVGTDALVFNDSGGFNSAVGAFALYNNTEGEFNTAVGADALIFNTSGSDNIALGEGAGSSLTTGDNNIDIGAPGSAGESGTIHIGTNFQTVTYIAGISGATVPTGVSVIVDSNGHLGTTTSSERFKDEIKPMEKASEAILALKPVTFRYKQELDPDGIPQFGLVAEQVEKVNPDLVARDEQGKPYTVRYDAVNAMLLNEFLKEHRKVEELTKQFRAANAQHQKQIDALTAGLQKVSAQLEASKPAPRVVVNKP